MEQPRRDSRSQRGDSASAAAILRAEHAGVISTVVSERPGQEHPTMRRGVVAQFAKNLITEALIKGGRLERVTVEPYATAAACARLGFGSFNQPPPVALS